MRRIGKGARAHLITCAERLAPWFVIDTEMVDTYRTFAARRGAPPFWAAKSSAEILEDMRAVASKFAARPSAEFSPGLVPYASTECDELEKRIRPLMGRDED